jgi:hypothetical protein
LVNLANDLEPRCIKKNDENNNFDQIIFHDLSAFTIISEASLNDLNSKLKKPVKIQNFRPNFYVSDCGAFSEVNFLSAFLQK